MNPAERLVLFTIGETPGANFAQVSFQTRYATAGLQRTLNDLARRNFVAENDGRYTLRPGVKAALQSPALNE